MVDITEEELVAPRFIGLIASAFCFFFARGMTIPILSPFTKDGLGGTNLTVVIVFGIVAVSSICVRPLIASHMDSWGCPRMVLLALAINRVSDEDRPRAVSTSTMFFDIGGAAVMRSWPVGPHRLLSALDKGRSCTACRSVA